MAYTPIRTSIDVAARLVPGNTREDHWRDFKGLDATTGRPYRGNDNGKDELRLDVATFANADDERHHSASVRNHRWNQIA